MVSRVIAGGAVNGTKLMHTPYRQGFQCVLNLLLASGKYGKGCVVDRQAGVWQPRRDMGDVQALLDGQFDDRAESQGYGALQPSAAIEKGFFFGLGQAIGRATSGVL